MRTLQHDIYHSDFGQKFRLYHITDLHLGAKACDEKLLQRDIATIEKDPHAYWILGGDTVDGICELGDKRFRPALLAKWVLRGIEKGNDSILDIQAQRAITLLSPIAHKCVGIVNGNHELAALKYYRYDLYWQIVLGLANAAGVNPNRLALGIQGFVLLNFRYGEPGNVVRSWQFKIALHHGHGGGRLPGGHALALGRMLGDFDCDMVLMGHRHTQVYVSKVIVTPFGNRTRIGMFTPSYLHASVIPSTDERPLDTYVDEKGLPPQVLGTVPIVITPGQRRVEVVMSNKSGIQDIA